MGRAAQAFHSGAAAPAAAAPVAAAAPPEPPKVKEFFDLKLVSYDAKAKIKIIKEVRTVTSLGLKEVSINHQSLFKVNYYIYGKSYHYIYDSFNILLLFLQYHYI